MEEQFYLLYPLLLLPLARLGRHGRIGWIGSACLVTLAIGAGLTMIDRPAGFYLLPGRMWELLTGALIAVLFVASGRRCPTGILAGLAACAGLGAIVIPMIFYHGHMVFPGLAAVPPVLGAATLLIAGTAERPPLVSRLLSLRPFVWLGLVSYGFYLWHWPLLVLQKQFTADPFSVLLTADLSVLERIGAALAALVLAWGSYRYVEQPIRRQILLPRPHALVAMFVIAATGIFGYGLAAEAGLLRRFPKAEDAFLAQEAVSAHRCGHWLNGMIPGDFCRVADGRPGRGGVLLLGDSHAGVLSLPLADSVRRFGLSLDVNRVKCPIVSVPIPASCAPDDHVLTKEIRRHDIRLVVLAERWDRMVEGLEPNGVDAVWGRLPFTEEERQRRGDLLEAALVEAFDRLRRMGIQVAVMKQVPQMPFLPTRHLAQRIRLGLPVRETGKMLSDHRAFNRHVEAAINRAATGRAIILDPSPLLCDSDGLCRPATPSGTSRYIDEDHLSHWKRHVDADVRCAVGGTAGGEQVNAAPGWICSPCGEC
ncbi:acyltransferase family protein [Tistrella bauzanensis]